MSLLEEQLRDVIDRAQRENISVERFIDLASEAWSLALIDREKEDAKTWQKFIGFFRTGVKR